MNQEKRKRDGRAVKKASYISPEEIQKLIYANRLIRYTEPWRIHRNATSTTEDNFFIKDAFGKPTEERDRRPLILAFDWAPYHELYYLLTYEHWKQCAPGMDHPNKLDFRYYRGKLVKPWELPRINPLTKEMFPEDVEGKLI